MYRNPYCYVYKMANLEIYSSLRGDIECSIKWTNGSGFEYLYSSEIIIIESSTSRRVLAHLCSVSSLLLSVVLCSCSWKRKID